ncbi:MAG: transcriptional regulator [Deltaproteobacteria bacterium]|nr:MAG: transcriptional regulator [Deltaproteobacteria bacterium]
MKGYTYRQGDQEPSGSLPMWEALVTGAVGDVIEFWGFKRNHGRVWALLYVRNQPMNARELREGLDLSKGAVSMITQDLEHWEVIRRVHLPGNSAWHFVAEVEFMRMISRVLQRREGTLIARVSADLDEALRLASESEDLEPEILDRIQRMRTLATTMRRALRLFTRTARFDFRKARGVL